MSVKYRMIADELSARIRRGELGNRERLPGELELAEQYSVSRGTVRQALASLQQVGLIRTWTGAGSFVSYDGDEIDDSLGWSEALARHGVVSELRLIALGRMNLPELAAELQLGSPSFLVVERVRSNQNGEAISLERSRIPWRDSLDSVVANGLIDDSLQTTLSLHGLQAVGGEESITLSVLGSSDAGLLGRSPGTSFLCSDRTTYDTYGETVERVTSLLDPQHFGLRHTFGRAK